MAGSALYHKSQGINNHTGLFILISVSVNVIHRVRAMAAGGINITVADARRVIHEVVSALQVGKHHHTYFYYSTCFQWIKIVCLEAH